MSLSAKLRRAPLRITTGAFILNSGIGKFGADEATAGQLHGMASNTYGFFGKLDPKTFTKVLAAGETALGAAVLLPIVPPVVAGAGLIGFSGLLLNLWWNTEGMHEPGSPRPTVQGTGVAKDVWMFGAGAGLLADALFEPAHNKKVELGATASEKKSQKAKQARKAAKRSKNSDTAAKLVEQAKDIAQVAQVEVGRRAVKAAAEAAKAQKQAAKAAAKAAKKAASTRDQYGPVVVGKAKQARDTAKDLADTYGPVVAEKATQARDSARDAASTYGPVAAERAKAARDAARSFADERGSAVAAAARAKLARDAAAVAADSAAVAATS